MTEYEYLLGNILTLQQSGLQRSSCLRLMLVPGQGPRASKAPRLYMYARARPLPIDLFLHLLRTAEWSRGQVAVYSFDSG